MKEQKYFNNKPCEKIYKAMDKNGNAVYKVFWFNGTYTIEKGQAAIMNPIGNRDKFYKNLSSMYRAK